MNTCMSVRLCVFGLLCGCVCVSGWEHLCGCSVLYASEPVPAGIRKVDLGHKYLISVCCPWKSSIYSWPNGKMPLPDPFPLTRRQKGMGLREAVRGTLTWCGWSRMEATAGEKKKKRRKSSSAADEKSSPGSYRWIAFTKPPSLFVCSEKNCYVIQWKAITHRKILDIMCLILSYCQTE